MTSQTNKPQLENLTLETKGAARCAFEDVLEGAPRNPTQERLYLQFISASARYLRALNEMKYLVDHPNAGFPAPRTRGDGQPKQDVPAKTWL